MYTKPAEKTELIFTWAYAVELFFESVEIKQHSLYDYDTVKEKRN